MAMQEDRKQTTKEWAQKGFCKSDLQHLLNNFAGGQIAQVCFGHRSRGAEGAFHAAADLNDTKMKTQQRSGFDARC